MLLTANGKVLKVAYHIRHLKTCFCNTSPALYRLINSNTVSEAFACGTTQIGLLLLLFKPTIIQIFYYYCKITTLYLRGAIIELSEPGYSCFILGINVFFVMLCFQTNKPHDDQIVQIHTLIILFLSFLTLYVTNVMK